MSGGRIKPEGAGFAAINPYQGDPYTAAVGYVALLLDLRVLGGQDDDNGIWRPDATERLYCCFEMESAWPTDPDVLWTHCRSVSHWATKYDVRDVDLMWSVMILYYQGRYSGVAHHETVLRRWDAMRTNLYELGQGASLVNGDWRVGDWA